MTELLQVAAEYFEPLAAGYIVNIHPAADALPMLEDDAAASLLADVKAHGLRERIKIWIDQDRETLWLVDGRNRTRAAAAAGLKCDSVVEWVNFDDDAEVARYVFSLNLERRHLNTSQRSMAGARLAPMFEEAARARQATSTGGADPQLQAKLPEAGRQARDDAADALNVSARSVQHAKKVLTDAPELAPLVDAGQLPVSAAAKLAGEDEETRAEVASAVSDGVKWKKALATAKRKAARAEVASAAAPPPTGVSVEQRDAVEWIRALEDKSVNLLLTDPPYNVTNNDWDSWEEAEDYWRWMGTWLEAMRPKLAEDAVSFVFCDARVSHRLRALLEEHGYAPRCQAIWHRPNLGKRRSGVNTFLSSYEPFWHCGGSLRFPEEWGEERFDVQRVTAPQSNHLEDKAVHPTQKPLALFRRLVRLGSDEGALVVDPFLGSGTSAVAAHLEGRSFAGCDQSAEYVDIALGRLASAKGER
jgi:site-specific DNA-methyltransferase (adenine-specific)